LRAPEQRAGEVSGPPGEMERNPSRCLFAACKCRPLEGQIVRSLLSAWLRGTNELVYGKSRGCANCIPHHTFVLTAIVP
jgi:hypothetical protein